MKLEDLTPKQKQLLYLLELREVTNADLDSLLEMDTEDWGTVERWEAAGLVSVNITDAMNRTTIRLSYKLRTLAHKLRTQIAEELRPATC